MSSTESSLRVAGLVAAAAVSSAVVTYVMTTRLSKALADSSGEEKNALQTLSRPVISRARTLERQESAPTLNQALGFSHVEQKEIALREAAKKENLYCIFKSLAGEDLLLSFEEFHEALTSKLQLDLSEEEIRRVWSKISSSGRNPLSLDEDHMENNITFDQFKDGVINVSFLRLIVAQFSEEVEKGFVISPSYDYNRSTNENYGMAESKFVGKYVHLRESRDYSYHTNYTPERQLWQDRAVDSVVARTNAQAQPWIVFTCGPMGAGKGYVLSWMSRNGYFPLETIVHIDPDHFKRLMPEWSEYTKRSEQAGNFCHRESGFIQEIAQEVAMMSSQNVWIDGSLRDGPWFASVFRDINRRFPNYKIAIFEIGAREENVRARIASRAAATGRSVPEALIQASLASVASSLEILTPLCDFVARIGNDGPLPELRAYIRVDNTGNWGLLESQFAKPEEAGSFPGSMAPLQLVPAATDIFVVVQTGDGSSSSSNSSSSSSRNDNDNEAAFALQLELNVAHPDLHHLRSALKWSGVLDMSPICKVTLDPAARGLAGIPQKASSFAWVYPATLDWSAVGKGLEIYSNGSCLVALAGSFVYFDDENRVCAVNAVSKLLDEHQTSSVAVGDGCKPETRTERLLLQFSSPLPLPEATLRAMAKRLRPITLAALLSKGAVSFAWINPGEMLQGFQTPPASGAFAYMFNDGTAIYFPIA